MGTGREKTQCGKHRMHGVLALISFLNPFLVFIMMLLLRSGWPSFSLRRCWHASKLGSPNGQSKGDRGVEGLKRKEYFSNRSRFFLVSGEHSRFLLVSSLIALAR